jgi:hypothetical protein
MNISIRHLTAFAIVLSGSALAACNVAATDNLDSASAAISSDGSEAVSSNVQHASFADLAFDVSEKDPQKAAVEAVAAPSKIWNAGCRTRKQDATNPAVVHIHFDDCTGPFGLRHLSGDETAIFSSNPDGTLHVALSDDGDLTVNGKPVQHSGAGDITIAGTQRNIAWKGAWDRTNDKGETVSHTTDLAIVVDTQTGCRTSNGTAVTLVANREIDTKFENLELCRTATGEGCPSGTVVHTGKKSGKSVTVEFDGTAEAAVTGPFGHTAQVPLVCTP